MVDIQSKDVIDKISEELKVQPSMQIPRELAKQIQLVYDVNPVPSIKVQAVSIADASTADSILTASATKRTFVIGALLTVTKAVLNASTISFISLTPLDKANFAFISIRYEPLTAGNHHEVVMLPIPIEIAKGSNVNVNNGEGTASIDATGIVYFFELDPQ